MSSNNPPHPITLFCWILDVSDRSFSVTIQTTRTVDQLKEEIVKKKPNAFVNVDPDQLDLWKVRRFALLEKPMLTLLPQGIHRDQPEPHE